MNYNPAVSIVIPSVDGYRGGLLPKLLESFKKQSFQDFEVIVMKGYKRQGKAINEGVKKAKGEIVIILDDDIVLGTKDVFKNLVNALKNDSHIGMAGVSNLIPSWAPRIVRRAMKELPRRHSELVNKVTESDLAEHPCCAIPKKVFLEVGGESELIPRGLDPYLRNKIRKAGYKIVVIPKTWIHHLLPASFKKILWQYFRNGKDAAYANKFYPELVFEVAQNHQLQFKAQRPFVWRILRFPVSLIWSVLTLRWIYFSVRIAYALGFIWGYLTLSKRDT